jgi:uracil-DNA glycosylase family 4
MAASLKELNREIIECRRCPRLIEYCQNVARVKRRAFRDWDYWGRPVPSFGDAAAQLLIVGLAPAAHGANRTGRMFTGDSSGDFLYRALYETGFASHPTSDNIHDGLTLSNVYITSSAHCAPPDNKPAREEIAACRSFLTEELRLLKRLRVVVALGRIGFDNYLSVLQDEGRIPSRSAYVFGHNVAHELPPGLPVLISSYHPSRQNTSTGKLTAEMLRAVFEHARQRLK